MVDSPGSTTPTLQSEIFVQSDRMAAFVLMGIHRWGLFALLGLIFPFMIVSAATRHNPPISHQALSQTSLLFPSQNALNSYCFLLFACVCLLGSLFTFFVLPETKGKTLMEISAEFRTISVCGISFSEQQSAEGTKL